MGRGLGHELESHKMAGITCDQTEDSHPLQILPS